ncbi:hypothetical protein GCM10023222_15880 [Saccharopolyspora cebuensis]
MVFALSAFLVCLLSPHHSWAEESARSGVSASAGHASAADAAAASDADHPDGGEDHPAPVCHATNGHVADVVKPVQGLLAGLLAALFVAVAAVRPDARARARWWSTRPLTFLSGFRLLLALGVSRT